MQPTPEKPAKITPANMMFPFSNHGRFADISTSTLVLMAASPLMGWAVYFLVTLRIDAIDRLMLFFFIFPFGAHLILPVLFHAEADHRNFMWKSPIRFYLIPALLALLMVYSSFQWWAPAAVGLAMASGFHIGMQHYGIMRLIDRKLGLAKISQSQRRMEKLLFLTCAMLPTAIFSLKIMHLWSTHATAISIGIAALATVLLIRQSFKQYRNVPSFRLIALWSFATMATPWAFFYRFDFNEMAFLVAGLGHSLQYFVCFRLFLSGKSLGQFGTLPNIKNMRFYYLLLFGVVFVVAWAAFENIQRNFLTSLIWALSAIHIYYDSLFWKNDDPHFRTHVMQPFHAAIDRIKIK